MSDYAVLKKNLKSKESFFLMANAVGTKTFRNDFRGAWTCKDYRVAAEMLYKCVEKHKDKKEFYYSIDDLSEVGDW